MAEVRRTRKPFPRRTVVPRLMIRQKQALSRGLSRRQFEEAIAEGRIVPRVVLGEGWSVFDITEVDAAIARLRPDGPSGVPMIQLQETTTEHIKSFVRYEMQAA